MFKTFNLLCLVTLLLLTPLQHGCARQDKSTSRVFTTQDGVRFALETVATNLHIPWSLAFNGEDLYITERPGRVLVLKKGRQEPAVIAVLRDVSNVGEGGLMGMAFHPSFKTNRYVYLSYTYSDDGAIWNKVTRFVLTDDRLGQATTIISRIPGGTIHNGCRIRFGPDSKLYVTTGDAAKRELAQDMESLAGKLLRLNDDGSIPDDNPFPGSPFFSIGHRNSQGIDWHPVTGILYSTEHGPSGFDGTGGGDEINMIESGGNYGWPVIHHQKTGGGMINPLLEFTPAIAPSGASFYSGDHFPDFNGNMFVATLRGRHLLRVILPLTSKGPVTERLLEGVVGRLRDVIQGPDGSLYLATSNRDGRGSPMEGDDRVFKLIPIN